MSAAVSRDNIALTSRLRRRDLKPENILLNANGHALLTDFDLSYCSKGTYPELIKKTPPRKVRAGGSLSTA